MISLLLFIITVCVSAIVIRICAIALELSGVPEEKAYFQALSAFSGVGYTTSESDLVLAHPQRRNIIRWLIRLGSAGVITSVGALAGALISSKTIAESFMHGSYFSWVPINPTQLILLVLTIIFLLFYYLLRIPSVARLLKEIISVWLLKEQIVAPVFHVEIATTPNNYSVYRVEVRDKNPLIGKSAQEVGFSQQGITLLALERATVSEPYPVPSLKIERNDVLLLFGPREKLEEICCYLPEKDPLSSADSKDSLLPLMSVAPDFSLLDQNGDSFSLSSCLGSKVVILIFYPKDKSYYCSTVLKSFTEILAELKAQQIEVIGINPQSVNSHQEFCDILSSKLPILSDPKKSVCRAYRALMLAGLLVNRSVYIVDKQGKIRFAARGRPPTWEIVAEARRLVQETT